MISPTISIIIPIFNGELLVVRCLDSVFAQSSDINLEVIVIDDGSTDNSVKIVQDYPHPIRLLQQPNLGSAAARNKGIEASTGKYVAFLDADDYWESDFLLETLTFLEDHRQAVAVSVGQLHKIPRKPDVIVPRVLQMNPEKYTHPILLENFFDFWSDHNHVCTGSVLMHSEIVKETGGQRPELRITEDLEFWAYLATFGQWGFIPKVLFVSDGGAVSRQMGWFNKNKKRWASAPNLEQWEKRIRPCLQEPLPAGYLRVRSRMAQHLAYFMLLSKREGPARKIILENKDALPGNRLTKLMKKAAPWPLAWHLLCKILYYRELTRKM